jgi:5-methylcytosine-specific restriction enzyme subunit McrC
LNAPAAADVAPVVGGKIVHSIESRKSLELNLADLVIDGRLEIFPHVEEKGLLFLQFRRSRLILSAGPYIGLIPLTPQVSIDVRPKLPVSNLARVLDAARRSLTSITGADRLYLANDLASSSVLEFLAANLLDSLRPIIAKGLHKEYVRCAEMTSHPRGRIELAGTLRAWSRGQFHKVQAQRFEQTSDIAVNRLIKAALQFVLRRIRPDSQGSRALIRRANTAYFELPGIIGNLRPSDYEASKATHRKSSLPATRSYYYRPLEIALLILSNRGVALQEHGNDVLLETFIINFEELFEEYLRRVLQQQARGDLTVRDGNREGKKPLFDDTKEHPAQPDIVLAWRPTGRTVIAEVKYKDRPDRSDINQVIAYALSYDTNRAVLVHQSRPGSPKGLSLIGTIRGIKIEAYAFDLGADNLDSEEAAFTQCLFDLVRPPHVAGVAA